MVRVTRIELVSPAWEAGILPVYYTREVAVGLRVDTSEASRSETMEPPWGVEPQTSALRKRRSSQLS